MKIMSMDVGIPMSDLSGLSDMYLGRLLPTRQVTGRC